MGVHSAFFGPSKYGLLPELLPEKKLSWGNGLLELGTFMAIILGTVAAALDVQTFSRTQTWSGVILIGLAVVGPRHESGHHPRARGGSRARNSSANFLGDLFAQMRRGRGDRPLILPVLGNTYFIFLGQLLFR